MGLVDLQTNLKSFKFGKDRVGGGSSKQPYIVRDIPDSFSDVGRTGGPDFLLRGGTLFPRRVVNDVSRLSQMFFDFKSVAGPLFLAKQNLLSLTNPNTATEYKTFKEVQNTGGGGTSNQTTPQTAIGRFIQDNLALNQGIYTPLSTLAAAAGNAVGVHPNKQGLNPFNPLLGQAPGSISNTPEGLTLPTYIKITDGGADGKKSRLLGFLDKINNKPSGNQAGSNLLYEYTGGPGANLGVGKTTISMLNDQRTGINNPNIGDLTSANTQIFNFSLPTPIGSLNVDGLFYQPNKFDDYTPATQKTGVSDNILDLINNDLKFRTGAAAAYITNNAQKELPIYLSGFDGDEKQVVYNIYNLNNNKFSLNTKVVNEAFKSGIGNNTKISTLTQNQLIGEEGENLEGLTPVVPTSKDNKFNKPNFTTLISDVENNELIPKSPDYTDENKRIEGRVNLGDPGRKGNLKSYKIGKLLPQQTKAQPLDKITALPLYKSSGPLKNSITNDLVKFRIGVMNNDNPLEKTYVHFRALIEGVSDSYTAEWNNLKFMGRGENYYKYAGFDRQVSLSWTVAAQSKQELIPMHQKLNYLASVCAPDYSNVGYMRGNLITLTVGGWFYEQPGIMTGLELSVPDDSPWEIAIDDEGNSDSSVKELPMIVNVGGFNFIPIHDFVPRVQQNSFNSSTYFGADANYINTYGAQRYIGLTNGISNNYDTGIGTNYSTQKPDQVN